MELAHYRSFATKSYHELAQSVLYLNIFIIYYLFQFYPLSQTYVSQTVFSMHVLDKF